MNSNLPEYLRLRVAGCEKGEVLFDDFAYNKFSRSIQIGNELSAVGRYVDAVEFFRFAYSENRQSKHVLLRLMELQLKANDRLAQSDKLSLKELDDGYYKYLLAQEALKEGRSVAEVLDIFENCFESFDSGSEPEWLFIRKARLLANQSPVPHGESNDPQNLFFYWDRNDAPSEVDANFAYHRSLKMFEVHVFSRDSAAEFLFKYFGLDARNLFLNLKHPSEQSDFIRFHAVYALGGYYLDVDEAILSEGAFKATFGGKLYDVFILAASGPVHSAIFGARQYSPIIDEAIRVLTHNCYLKPDLSLWLKTGPGPITRAISRLYYRNRKLGISLPEFYVLDELAFPRTVRAVDVSYRNDARDWRVYEASKR